MQSQPAISPVMSISQLLSSDTPTTSPSVPEQPVYSPIIQHVESKPKNGIQNLLNSEEENSDTDTEDIPLIRSPKVIQQHQQNQREVIIGHRDPVIVTSKVGMGISIVKLNNSLTSFYILF